jgi:predicted nucleic acid-binding protein
VVLDASAAVRLAVRAPDSAQIRLAVTDVAEIVAPTLFTAEVANAVWRLARAGRLDQSEALAATLITTDKRLAALATSLGVPTAP